MPRAWLASESDSVEVTRLLVAFRDHLGRVWPPEDMFAAKVSELMDDGDSEFVLVGDDGRAQAIAVLRFRSGIWRGGLDCLVEDVFVEADSRGEGVGRALMAFAVQRARERGARRMELDVREDNAAALSLYRSIGFTERFSPVDSRDLYMRLHLD